MNLFIINAIESYYVKISALSPSGETEPVPGKLSGYIAVLKRTVAQKK